MVEKELGRAWLLSAQAARRYAHYCVHMLSLLAAFVTVTLHCIFDINS